MTTTSSKIPFYKPSLPPLQDYVNLLEKIWDSRMLSNFSIYAQQLEKNAADYLGCKHVKAVVSGDIGLIITLRGLELPAGAPCFLSDFTFNSTINAVLWAGLKPVLVDIHSRTLNISPDALSVAMKKHRGPGAVLATHVFGNPADIVSLQHLAREHESFLVFDSAHALGSKSGGKPVGTFGDAEVFSLSGTKIVTSAEGGLITTPHKWLADRLTYLRAYGFQNDYNSRYIGINGKMSEIHSALAILSLKQIEESLTRRKEIVDYYRSKLGDRVGWQEVRDEDRSTFKDISINLGRCRSNVEKFLELDQIQSKRYFLPLHYMEPYKAFMDGSYPISEQVYDSTLCLPAFTDLGEEDLDRISKQILAAIESV